jgi:argininosuccinate synthase
MTTTHVLAYSGDTAGTAEIQRLSREPGAEVVTVTLDLGQRRDVGEIRDRALAAGAARAHVFDVRDEFARDCVLPALRRGVPVDPATLAAPLIDAKLAEIAAIERAQTSSHPAAVAADNLLCRPVVEPARAPEAPAQLDLVFEAGVPTAINGVSMPLAELIESVSLIAGRHGVGRLGDVEAPAAVVLQAAWHALREPSGVVRISLHRGRHTVVSVEERHPVTHA